MEDKKTSAQTEANKRWRAKNREKARYLRGRSESRSFIRNRATEEDLKELEDLIANKKEKLKRGE